MVGSSTETRRETSEGAAGRLPVVLAEPQGAPLGTVLVLHGRNGAPDQPQIAAITAAYLARGWRVAVPELPFSEALPASGSPGQLTMAGHRAAAAQVWDWIARRWPEDKAALAGHSLGAFAAAHLGRARDDTHHVLAVSPALSGRALLQARIAMGPSAVAALEREVPLMRAGMEAEDAAPALAALKAPLAVITGALDGIVPVSVARAYFMAAPEARLFAALPGQHHCPDGPDYAALLVAALTVLEA